jgi:hypothetical protein
MKQHIQSSRLWLLSSASLDFPIHEAIALSFLLEEHISQSFQLYYHFLLQGNPQDIILPPVIADLIDFYNKPELSSKQITFSHDPLTKQLLQPKSQRCIPANPLSFLTPFLLN